jgi:biopolymer transport protein ExbD
VDSNGVTTWDQKIVTLSEITNGLKAMTKTEQTQVLIAADEEARHKQVLSVLNAVREAGIEKVSFESKQTPPN